MSAPGWSQDFCLSCDTLIYEGAYCSQACRLKDFERGQQAQLPGPFHPSSRTSSVSSSAASTYSLSGSGGSTFPLTSGVQRGSSYHMAMPSMRRESLPAPKLNPMSLPSSKPHKLEPLSAFDMRPSDATPYYKPQSAASSTSSSPTFDSHLSESARKELKRYDNAFDAARRRRNTTVP